MITGCSLSPCLRLYSGSICTVALPATEVGLASLQFPESSFLPFYKMGAVLPFVQLGSPKPHDFRYDGQWFCNINQLSENTVEFCGSSDAIDLWLFSFLRWF